MTTRQLKRVGGLDLTDRSSRVTMDPAPSVAERLYAARERKGVDLFRAERDTKIRARYLGALERGDYKELPAAVYTKGFLRNYALYLELDPDEVLIQWRRERGGAKEAPPPIVVPRPIAPPRKPLTLSPSVFVVAALTVVIVAFGVYLGVQVLRFAKPPTIAVSQPATAVIDVEDALARYTLKGATLPGATVSIATPGRDPYQVTARPDGAWAADVDLRRGRNQFDVNALDPETGKRSEETIRIFITVPFLVIEAPTLTVDQPSEGASFENGAIPVAGRAPNAASVVVSARYLGPSDSGSGSGAGAEPGTTPGASKNPGAAGATPVPPPAPGSSTLTVAADGTFGAPFELTAGRWALTVSASSQEGKTSSLTRHVTVAYRGVTLGVTIRSGRAWVKAWVDGKVDTATGASGLVVAEGTTLTFSGRESVEVRTGSSGVTSFTLNGKLLGPLGRSGTPETWLFAPPEPPQKTQRR